MEHDEHATVETHAEQTTIPTTTLSQQQIIDLRQQLERFIVDQQQTFVRPICLVSSGGTAVDLEVNAVRCLDNFSTGLRGAISVEEFLKRGYSVIHLQREGSASPFARVLSNHLGLQQSNFGLTASCLGKLFMNDGEDNEDDLVQSVLDEESDPWMTNSDLKTNVATSTGNGNVDAKGIKLHHTIVNSLSLSKALKERSDALREGRLLTIPFRTVEQYLVKLQICAEALSSIKSLAIFFLAAAVSDFYIPISDKAIHKIQSASNNDGLRLHLKPVPKCLGTLRQLWSPEAFVVSFKLETDIDILRSKAMRSIENYGCHMVIGNLLQSRHNKVWVLAPENFQSKSPTGVENWPMIEVTKDRTSTIDSLESEIIDIVVRSHFEFISYHYNPNGSAFNELKGASEKLSVEKKREQRMLMWRKAKGIGLEIIGAALTLWISYSINAIFQRRHQKWLTIS
jgi:phosphopantothenate---cysteine ligase (ATP)